MKAKLKTATWFAKRPAFWSHGAALVGRKFSTNYDTPALRAEATKWARDRAVSVPEALTKVGLLDAGADLPVLSPEILRLAEERAAKSQYKMGGAGDLALLYAAVALSDAKAAVETGVAYGWSSLAILTAMQKTGGRLSSVDMPYVKAGNEPWVGIVVPEEYRKDWTLIREPDRNGLRRAIATFPGGIDFAHYDSDKSYHGRQYAYPLIWEALKPGGVFISDDIQDNSAFSRFVEEKNADFAVTTAGGKFAGILRKRKH